MSGHLERLTRAFLPAVRSDLDGPHSGRGRNLSPTPRRASSLASAARIGDALFTSLLSGKVRSLFDRSLGSVESTNDVGLRIKLKLDLDDGTEARLHSVPWELLYRSETAQYLGLRRRCPIVRYLDVPQATHGRPLPETLRILAVAAQSPEHSGHPPLDLATEWRNLEHLSHRSNHVEVTRLDAANLYEVRNALLDRKAHVLHFMGHGSFDPVSGTGSLLFAAADGRAVPVTSRALVTVLKDLPDLRLVVLNACNTGRAGWGSGVNPFAGLAPALMRGGLPAVLAMQLPISDRAALELASAFYGRLAAGDPVDTAVNEGRQAIHAYDGRTAEWAIPALFMRVADGALFEPRGRRHSTGIDHLKAGNYAEAVSELRRALAANPYDVVCKSALGVALGRGTRLSRLDYRTAREMHRLFADAARSGDGEGPGVAALVALKLDYFRRNSVREDPPPLERAMALLARASCASSEGAILGRLNMTERARTVLEQTCPRLKGAMT